MVEQVLVRMRERAAGRVVWVIALLLFSLTSSRYPFPQDSAQFLVTHLQLTPFLSMTSPVWGWFVRALDYLRMGSPATLPNALSVACGTVSVWLLYDLVRRMSYPDRWVKGTPYVHAIAGCTAALYFAVSSPSLLVHNRAHPMALGVLMLLAACWFLQRFVESRQIRHALASAALCSVGGLELGTVALFAPFLILYGFAVAYGRRQVRAGFVISVLIVLLLGPGLLLLAAWQYQDTQVAAWREFEDYGQVLYYFFIEALNGLRGGMVKQGWLIIALTTFVPWFACYVMSRQKSHGEAPIGTVFLNLILTGIAGVVLFDGPLSPFRLAGAGAALLVTPHLFAAATFGYLAGFWICYIQQRIFRRRHHDSPWPSRIVVAAACIAITTAGVLHVRSFNGRHVADFHRVAREMLGSLEGRMLLVTDGLLDSALQIEAHGARLNFKPVNLKLADSPVYRKYVATLTDDPALQNMARVGVVPMLLEWLRSKDDLPSKLAFQMTPDYWLASGHAIRPYQSLYLGAPDFKGLDYENLLASHVRFWEAIGSSLGRLTSGTSPVRDHSRIIAAHLSSVANDLGVLFENGGRPDLAVTAYGHALDLTSENLSALVNLATVLQQLGRTAEERAVRVALQTRKDATKGQIPLKALVEVFGHIRSPASLVAIKDVLAGGTGGQDMDPALGTIIAAIGKRDYASARDDLEKLLKDNPATEQGWILLAMVAYHLEDEDLFKRCTTQMSVMEKEWPEVVLLQGQIALKKGDVDEARSLLERAAVIWPNNIGVHEALVKLDLAAKDYKRVEVRLRSLLSLDRGNVVGNFAMGLILYKEEKLELAAESYRKALERQRFVPAINNLAWILAKLDDTEKALELAGEAIVLDPESSSTWDTLGIVHIAMRQYDEAEKALQKARQLAPDSLDQKVHLVLLEIKRGNHGAAHDMARTLRSDPENRLDPEQDEMLSKALRGEY